MTTSCYKKLWAEHKGHLIPPSPYKHPWLLQRMHYPQRHAQRQLRARETAATFVKPTFVKPDAAPQSLQGSEVSLLCILPVAGFSLQSSSGGQPAEITHGVKQIFLESSDQPFAPCSKGRPEIKHLQNLRKLMSKDGNLLDRAVPSLPFSLKRGCTRQRHPTKCHLLTQKAQQKEECNCTENIMGSPSPFQLKTLEDRSGSEEQETPASLTASW